MNLREYKEKKRIKLFELSVYGYEIYANLRDDNKWFIQIQHPNGVLLKIYTPENWAYTRVNQFIGDLIEARIP